MRLIPSILGAIAAVSIVSGHGDTTSTLAARRNFAQTNSLNLEHCSNHLKHVGIEARAIKRREITQQMLSARHIMANLEVIDRGEPWQNSHKYPKLPFKLNTEELFASKHSCVLNPEATEGPFYVAGEYLRQDLVENEPGTQLWLDLQIINVDTCQPIPNVYVEIWNANSTGTYSGISLPNDNANIHRTALRGFQETNSDGIVTFHTIFPGHYQGRTSHVHIAVHRDVDAPLQGQPSNDDGTVTITSNSVTHAGQMYFDQVLIDAVEEHDPYHMNKQDFVRNEDDGILKGEVEGGADPFVEYSFLDGMSAREGVFGWLRIGVSLENQRTLDVAATLGEDA